MMYLVSSLNRSGSSMMMRCLEAGGMKAAYDHEQDHLNVVYGRGDYLPNPNGFYALSEEKISQPTFAREYDWRLVKVPWQMLSGLPKSQYTLIWMMRAGQEICHSLARFIPSGFYGVEATVRLWSVVGPALFDALKARGDMTIDVVNYAQAVANPLEEFSHRGWPIDVKKAAAMVQPELYRSRQEV